MSGSGLRFPRDPRPPGGGRYALAVAAFLLVMTLVCVADRLGWFES